MTDIHTHILPGMDDGAKTAEDSLAMLRMEYRQGVDTVVLTPHFYRDREDPKHFLRRRKESVMALEQRVFALPEREQTELPRMILGAEVAWRPNLADWEELPELCIGDSKNLLLELPFTSWNDQMIHQLYEFYGRTGMTPVIAHLERYLKIQRPEHIRDVLDLGVPVQISADILLHPMRRSGAMKLLRRGQAHLVASDCHDCIKRPPNLAVTVGMLRKKIGADSVERLICCSEKLVEE